MAEIDSEQRGPGKPSKYRPQFCEQVIEMGLEGKSVAQMASALGVARTTLINWRGQYEDFNEAMALALTHAQAVWEQIGFDSLHRKDFQGAPYVKLMQARFRHDYTERTELTGADGAPLMRPTKIELVAGIMPTDHSALRESKQRKAGNVIEISPKRDVEPEALPEPVVELVAPSNLDEAEPAPAHPYRSTDELLQVYERDKNSVKEMAEDEEDRLTRAILKANTAKEQEARARHEAEQAERANGWNGLPPGIGGKRHKWVK